MNEFVSGAIFACCWVVGLLFAKIHRTTSDRLFLRFAIAFWLLGVERLVLLVVEVGEEWRGWVFVLRLAAFLTIIGAVVGKNRASRTTRTARRQARLRRIRQT